jgi:hypothetical protein
MEHTSPVVVYLESIEKTDRKFLDVTTRIDNLHREGRIDANTYTRFCKHIARVYDRVIDRITAQYHEMRNEERYSENQAQCY